MVGRTLIVADPATACINHAVDGARRRACQADGHPRRTDRGATMGVLEGITVVELSIAIAAPSCCRALAFHGADVLKIESRTNPDVARLFGSAWATGMDAGPYMDTSPYLAEMSANKRSVGLELKHPEARARRARADRRRRRVRHELLDAGRARPRARSRGPRRGQPAASSTSPCPGFGSDPDQPYYEFLAWGPNQAPLVGLDELTGYPDQVPAGIATIAPPDYFAGLHALAAVLTALEHRDRTGEGSVRRHRPVRDDRVQPRAVPARPRAQRRTCRAASGNRLAWLAPQGCYRVRRRRRVGGRHRRRRRAGGRRWPTCSAATARDARFATLAGRARAPRRARRADRGVDERRARPPTRPPRCRRSASPRARCYDNTGVLADPQVRDAAVVPAASGRAASRTATCSAATRSASVPSPGRWWRAGPSMGEDTRARARSSGPGCRRPTSMP